MGERNSEYQRIEADTYVTPQWVYEELFRREAFPRVWDCAPVNATFDFLKRNELPSCFWTIATNPPYSLADEFCHHAIRLTERQGGKVAMLLRHAFDTAKSRKDLWAPPFKIKWVITQRIRWDNIEQKKSGPSSNHAWYVWDHHYEGPPMIGWI